MATRAISLGPVMEAAMPKRTTTPKSKSKGKKASKKPANTGQRGKAAIGSKTQACLDLLKGSAGASIAELQQATGWQPHSVRGFLAGTIKKIPNVELISAKSPDGVRRYHVKLA